MTGRGVQLLAQLRRQRLKVDLGKQFLDILRAHAGIEIVLIFLAHIAIILIAQDLLFHERRIARIHHDIGSKVQNLLQKARGNVQHQTDAGGDTLEIPNVRHGSGKLDVSHALTAHLCARDFHAAAFADLAFIADALIAAAVAFPVLRRPEDLFTEKTVTLGL